MKTFTVGVFEQHEHPTRKPMAYTRWYNPAWFGCCEHEVEAVNGTDAKKLAIAEHVNRCRAGKKSEVAK